MYKGFENLSDEERGRQFGAHQLDLFLYRALQDMTLDECIAAWYRSQGMKFDLMAMRDEFKIAHRERQAERSAA